MPQRLSPARQRLTLPEEVSAGPDEPQLSITGAQLSYEETAAVVSVIASLAGADSDENGDAYQTGPRDRRLQRRRSLTFSRIGLWGARAQSPGEAQGSPMSARANRPRLILASASPADGRSCPMLASTSTWWSQTSTNASWSSRRWRRAARSRLPKRP
ncbi:hypothetical protein [Nesterenkonia pannonica]|uniref:hypothetical protein n=1 Tax=Nesterenkonia pannonica TaxID=1548602 RepID=UPI0021644309|nr:hypothetical protein [Nesterenkonia pannonica]